MNYLRYNKADKRCPLIKQRNVPGDSTVNKDHLSLPILLVDDEGEALDLLKSILSCEGYQNITTFTDPQRAQQYIDQHDVSVVVLDLRMPGMSGQELLSHIAGRKPRVPVIVVTAENQIETAIDCMRIGAIDYLVKPVIINRFLAAVTNALEINRLDEIIQTPGVLGEGLDNPIPSIITHNRDMLAQIQYLKIIARSSQPILITGETGVGKELFAKAAHTLSGLGGQFVCVNVAGLDDLMFSDSLFGHKKGAYTGAMQDRDGLIKKAAKGTLFLDEIGDLKELSQIKLLRLIQEHEYYPLGTDTQVTSQARILLATNHDLKELVKRGEFRKDLYYRLCTHQITIPPLRKRPEDIPLLLGHFITEATGDIKLRLSVRQELIDLLVSYEFPGNARELQAMVLDIIARSPSGYLSTEICRDIISRERNNLGSAAIAGQSDKKDKSPSVAFEHFPTLKEAEDALIRRAMELAGNNQGRAALLLGITRQALNTRLRRNSNSADSTAS